MDRGLQPFDRATQIDRTCDIVQIMHGRVGRVVGTKHLGGFIRLVRQIFVGDGHHRQNDTFGIAQRDLAAGHHGIGEFLRHIEGDRDWPQRPVGSTHVFDDTLVIGFGMKALQRMETAVHQQFKITGLTRGQIPRRHGARLIFQRLGGFGRYIKLRYRSEIGDGHANSRFFGK